MHWASPLAGQVQGHQRERKPRVSIPDGFSAPAGPRREKGEQGRPHRYGPGCGMSSCVMLVGGGLSVSACACWWGGGDIHARPLGGAPLLQVP